MSWMKRIVPAALLLAAIGGGCQDLKNHKTAKQRTQEHWYAARAEVQYNLAKQSYELGELGQGRERVREALQMHPKHAPSLILSAKIEMEQGNLEIAEKALAEARAIDAKDAEVDYLSGVIYQRWQRSEEALRAYEAALEKAPTELAYVMARAEMLVHLNRRQEATRLLEGKVVFFENSAAIRDALAQLLQQEGRHAEAARLFRQASAIAPEDPGMKERLALALFHAGQWRDAADLLTKLTSTERCATRSDLFTALGECQLQLDKPREARQSFETAAQLDASSVPAWLGLAKTAAQLKDPRRAELSLRKALALSPNGAEAHLLTGYLRLEQGRTDEALFSFKRAAELDAKDPVSLCMVGYVLERQGRNEEAMKCYADALKRKPNDELASKLMASVDLGE